MSNRESVYSKFVVRWNVLDDSDLLTVSELEAIESQLSITLPESYRQVSMRGLRLVH